LPLASIAGFGVVTRPFSFPLVQLRKCCPVPRFFTCGQTLVPEFDQPAFLHRQIQTPHMTCFLNCGSLVRSLAHATTRQVEHVFDKSGIQSGRCTLLSRTILYSRDSASQNHFLARGKLCNPSSSDKASSRPIIREQTLADLGKPFHEPLSSRRFQSNSAKRGRERKDNALDQILRGHGKYGNYIGNRLTDTLL
jgi:hypothetical protein